MVIENSFVSLNLYIACSYQPKIQKQLKYNHGSGVYTYVLWVTDSNEKNILEHYYGEFE